MSKSPPSVLMDTTTETPVTSRSARRELDAPVLTAPAPTATPNDARRREQCRSFYESRSSEVRALQSGRYYHRLVENYFQFLIPPGASVLEIGCGLGDLLAALHPRQGVGIDFSSNAIAQARSRH